MSAPGQAKKNGVASFRTKLLVAMMLVVVALTGLGLFFAERKVAVEAERDLLQDFRNELATLHGVQAMRQAALAERCRDLVKRPRIHAALEDNALDLLYPSALNELRDLVEREGAGPSSNPRDQMHAKFYRFLDSRGAVISPPNAAEVGELLPAEEKRLSIPSLPAYQQLGYLSRDEARQAAALDELVVMPIVSSESGEVIAALVLGFKPVEFGRNRSETGIESGIWLQSRLYLPALTRAEQVAVGGQLERTLAASPLPENRFEMEIDRNSHLVFYKRLNPDSLYPPAYEVAVYPLADARARQRKIRTQVILAGAILLGVGLLASHFFSRRLSQPVEKLAVTSEKNRAGWKRAEEALESTSEELERAARFSADASHQLKTPMTVLRAGIEELLAREEFPPEVYDRLSALLHQTYRMTGMVNDLLLLSRMDAGSLQIQFETVNLSQLIEEWIDDLGALPDDLHVEVKTNFAPDLQVLGEKRYISIIMHNLLENARKYNIPGGEICVSAKKEGEFVLLNLGNTGRPIPLEAQAHIFERFHRGGMGENVPGHGLGLNLARELARLHGGDLRLVRSDAKWTEFRVRFKAARVTSPALASSA